MAQAETDEKLHTLTDVSKKTGISMPTLQRYKKLYQDRIPAVGSGRTQRYPEEALEVFEQLKEENIKRRGRPRKSGSARGRKPSASKRGRRKTSSDKDLLTLTQISKDTGISYPTLVRYAKMYPDQIPHEGSGRSRRYYPAAVPVFEKLRQQSRRGRKRKGEARAAAGSAASGDVTARLKGLEQGQKRLVKELDKLHKELRKPLKLTVQRR